MTATRRHGWALSALLALAVVADVYGLISYAQWLHAGLQTALLPPLSDTLIAVSALRMVAGVAIWCWIRDGVVLFVLLTVLVMAMLYVQGVTTSALSLVGVALLSVLIRNRWRDMRWLLRPRGNRPGGRLMQSVSGARIRMCLDAAAGAGSAKH
jgi:hypothetical protein